MTKNENTYDTGAYIPRKDYNRRDVEEIAFPSKSEEIRRNFSLSDELGKPENNDISWFLYDATDRQIKNVDSSYNRALILQWTGLIARDIIPKNFTDLADMISTLRPKIKASVSSAKYTQIKKGIRQ